MIAPRRTLIAAHRGGALLWPENSMTAFHGALTLPVDQIETDVRLSADGEPFLLHDATLDRTTEASGPATPLSWDELSAIRLLRTRADTIPHLHDILRLLAPGRVDLRLELKVDHEGKPQEALVALVIAALAEHGMTQRTTITSFDRRYLAAVAFSPLAGRIWLVHRSVLAEHGLDVVAEMASREGIEELAIHASQAADIGKTAQNARPKTGLYAVNDAAAIDRALAMGVPAFTTDRPDLAVAARDAAGAEPPRADALASAAN